MSAASILGGALLLLQALPLVDRAGPPRSVAAEAAKPVVAGGPGPAADGVGPPGPVSAIEPAVGVAPAVPSAAGTIRADTTLPVRRGDRLRVGELDGTLTLVARGGDHVRVVDVRDPSERVSVRRIDEGLVVSGRDRHRRLRIEVPPWLPVEIRGRELSVEARGTRGALTIRTLEGPVHLVDVTGEVDVHSVDGEIRAEGVAGRVRLRSVDEDVQVRGARGRLQVATTDGDVTLEALAVEELDVSSTDGDLRFEGRVLDAGRYVLVTHSGDIVAALPEGSDVRVRVSTFGGAFEADFPVTLESVRTGRQASFVLGRGGAELSLEAFDGDIRLRRPAGG